MSGTDPIEALTRAIERLAERLDFGLNEMQVKNDITQAMVEGIRVEFIEQAASRNQNNQTSGGINELPADQALGTDPSEVVSTYADMPTLIPTDGPEARQSVGTDRSAALGGEAAAARRGTLFNTAGRTEFDTGEHRRSYPYEPDHREAVRPQAQGRDTFMVTHHDNIPRVEVTPRRTPLAVGTVIHTQEKVLPSQQVNFLTFPALRVACENQDHHAAMYDQHKNLAFFVVPSQLRLLVANEHRLNRNWDMTDSSILTQPDEAFINMFCAYVRVMAMGTKKGFTATILSAVPPLRAVGDTGLNRRPMEVPDYDILFHAPVSRHMDQLEKAFEHAYRGATLQETRSWPVENYGKNEDYGQIQVLCKTLGPYRENFQHRIGLEKMKRMNRREWFLAIRTHNDELANLAMLHRTATSEIAPLERLDDIAREIEAKRSAPRVLMTKDGPRDVRLPNTPFPRQSGGYSGPSDGGAQRYPFRESARPQASGQARSAELEFVNELWNADDTFECDNPFYGDGMAELRRHGIEPDPDEEESRWRYFDQDQASALNAMNQPNRMSMAGRPRMPGVLFDPKAKREQPGPCFRHFNNRDCPGNCGFSHDQEQMHGLMQQRVQQTLDSPYTPLEYVSQEILARKQKHGGATTASVSRIFGTESPEADPPDFPNDLSQLSGMQSPGSRNDAHNPVAPSSAQTYMSAARSPS